MHDQIILVDSTCPHPVVLKLACGCHRPYSWHKREKGTSRTSNLRKFLGRNGNGSVLHRTVPKPSSAVIYAFLPLFLAQNQIAVKPDKSSDCNTVWD